MCLVPLELVALLVICHVCCMCDALAVFCTVSSCLGNDISMGHGSGVSNDSGVVTTGSFQLHVMWSCGHGKDVCW